MLPALAFALVQVPAPARDADALAATVVGRGGRVELVAEEGRVGSVGEGEARSLHGWAHLEVGAAARAEVSWPGVGSAVFVGPCVLEWGAAERAPGTAGERLHLCCFQLGRAELELRAPLAQLVLPDGWRLTAGRSAVGLADQGGGTRVELRAGAPLVIDGPRGALPPWPRRGLAAGAALVLDARRTAPGRVERPPQAPAWPRVDWPWGARAARVTPSR